MSYILSFGETPLADRLVGADQLQEDDPKVPLTLMYCPNCSLVQIAETVDPEVLFDREYPYFSSVSDRLMEHFGASAEQILETRDLGSDSLVVEAGSNDGYMLQNFVRENVPVLGIDPARKPVQKARERGVHTLQTFFNEGLAEELRSRGRAADVFLANNVLAHQPNLNGFVRGIRHVLKDDGLAVIEVPYVVDLVDHHEFDTIYHQHLCYFSVTALDNLFRQHDLYLNGAKRLSIHGGSLRLFVEPTEDVSASVERLLEMESERGVVDRSFYRQFARAVEHTRTELEDTVEELATDGEQMVGYGAAAKATTLLSYCDVDDALDYVVDLNTYKHGRYMPGNRLPIHPTDRLVEDTPDTVLLLAWNFTDEIVRQQEAYRRQGGRFLKPIPSPQIID